jgi:hypothetical protein
MEPVNSYDDVIWLEKKKQIIAVFVASGLDPKALTYVFQTWYELGRRSGQRWHVVVPLNKIPQHADDPLLLTHENFNGELAEQIRTIYGVSDDETPVLVFDDFNDEAHQLKVSLADEGDRARVIGAIDVFMKQHVPDNVQLADKDRAALIGMLYSYLQVQGIRRTAFGLLPKAGSALAKVAISQGAKWLARGHGAPIP